MIVTDEIIGEHSVVWVYASTSMSDPTTVLEAGVHPEITQRCCVIYERANIIVTADILAAVEGGALVQVESIFGEPLKEIQEGIFQPGETKLRVVNYCKDRI